MLWDVLLDVVVEFNFSFLTVFTALEVDDDEGLFEVEVVEVAEVEATKDPFLFTCDGLESTFCLFSSFLESLDFVVAVPSLEAVEFAVADLDIV